MRKLNPVNAANSPLAAAILGSILVKAGIENNDPDQREGGQRLLKVAEKNQDKIPRLNPNSKLAQAIKANRAASKPKG